MAHDFAQPQFLTAATSVARMLLKKPFAIDDIKTNSRGSDEPHGVADRLAPLRAKINLPTLFTGLRHVSVFERAAAFQPHSALIGNHDNSAKKL